mgnify:FL=1
MSTKDINKLRQDIYKNNPDDFLLTLNNNDLLLELYYSNSPSYVKSSEKIRSKYKNYDDWTNSFAPTNKSEKDSKKEKELKESPFNTQFVKSISDTYKKVGSPKITTDSFSVLKNLSLLKSVAMPQSIGKPSIMEGIAGDTQNVIGTGLNFLTLGKAKGPVGQTIADLGTLNKEIVIGADKLETIRRPTPGKSIEEFKTTRVVPQETTAGNVARGIGGYMIPFTGALKTLKAVTSTTKVGKKLLESKPRLTGAIQLYGATAAVDQLVVTPENAFAGQMLGTIIGEDKELLQTTLAYVTASPDKTEGENRVAVLFDSIFAAGAIKAVIVIGGASFRSGKELFNYFKGVKENGTAEQKEQIATFIKDASANNPKAKKKSETIKDTIEEQEIKLNNKIADGTSWQFSESTFRREFSNMFNIFTTSRGLNTPKMFATLNLNKNAAIAYQNLGVQLKTEIDNTVKKLVKSGKYTKDDLNKIIEVYLTKPNKDINKLVQTIFNKKEYDAFIKQQGNKSKFTPEDLPVELKELVEESRNHIDGLSKVLLGSSYIKDELKKEILDGYGSYLRKSYLKFNNPNYKPSQEVVEEAIVFITKQLKKAPENKNKNYTDKQFENMATAEVNNILKTAKYSDDFFNFIDNVKNSKQGEVVFAQRQKIAKEIENLLGVETEASSRIFNSLADVSQFISRQQTFSDFSQLGKGKYFFEKAGLGGKQFDTQLKGKQFGTLDGMWTTEQMARNFWNPLSQKQSTGYNALKFIYSAKGFAQASKTVGNNITHERNLQSSGIIMLSNGLNPFSPKTFKAVQVAWSAIKPTNNKAINTLYNDYLRLGITNQNAKLGDIKRLISESQKNVSGTYLDTLASKTGLKYLGRQVEKAYVAEDDIWKIAVYENELAILKKAYPKEILENLKLEAARITRNTMPTYDMIPTGFKVLRYSPVGNYFAFHAERFRNTFNSYKQAIDEIKSGNEVLKQRGYKRLGAQVTVGQTGALVVSSSSMYHTGVSKEEDTHIKNIFKQSYNGSNFLYDIQNSSGKLLYADPKYTDPSAPVNEVFTPMFEYLNTDKMTQPEFEDKFYTAASTAAVNFVSPFIDSTILFTAIMDIFSRDGKTVGPDGELFSLEGWDDTSNTSETKFNNTIIGLNHVVKAAFLPVFLDNITTTIEINKEQPDKYGITKDKDLNRIKNLAGINYKPIDRDNVLKRITQESKGFNSKTGDVRNKILNKNVGENNVTISKVKHQYLLANRNHYLNFTNFKRTVNSAIILQGINPDRYDYTKNDIEETLKNARVTKTYRDNLTLSTKRDMFIPLTLTDENIDSIIKMNPTINRIELEQELRDLKYELMDLPLLDFKEDYSEAQTKAIDTLYERKKYFDGGKVSKENPVSDALETPADRVNPATGLPFSDQMARLGLSKIKGK